MAASTDKLVPTLDNVGWVRYGVIDRLDRLLASFFTSDGLQSGMYYRTFKTLQVINQENASDVEAFRSELEAYLNTYLGKYFDKVSADVFFTDLQGNVKDIFELDDVSAIGFKLQVNVTENDKVGTIEKEIKYKNGVFGYVLDKFTGRV